VNSRISRAERILSSGNVLSRLWLFEECRRSGITRVQFTPEDAEQASQSQDSRADPVGYLPAYGAAVRLGIKVGNLRSTSACNRSLSCDTSETGNRSR